ELAVAQITVDRVDGRMAVQARAGLLRDVLPLCEDLVDEHVRVTPLLAEVGRECITGPELTQARVLDQPGRGDGVARVIRRRKLHHRLTAAVAGARHVDGACTSRTRGAAPSAPAPR